MVQIHLQATVSLLVWSYHLHYTICITRQHCLCIPVTLQFSFLHSYICLSVIIICIRPLTPVRKGISAAIGNGGNLRNKN